MTAAMFSTLSTNPQEMNLKTEGDWHHHYELFFSFYLRRCHASSHVGRNYIPLNQVDIHKHMRRKQSLPTRQHYVRNTVNWATKSGGASKTVYAIAAAMRKHMHDHASSKSRNGIVTHTTVALIMCWPIFALKSTPCLLGNGTCGASSGWHWCKHWPLLVKGTRLQKISPGSILWRRRASLHCQWIPILGN